MTWTTTPEARALLAAYLADPQTGEVTGTLGPNDREIRPTGDIVKQLERIRRAAEPTIDTPEWYEWCRLTVPTAIDEARELATRPASLSQPLDAAVYAEAQLAAA